MGESACKSASLPRVSLAMPKFVGLSSLLVVLVVLAGCPTSHGVLLPADEPPPVPESAPELPTDGFCARLIEFDQRGIADVGIDAVGTIVYDERGRYIRYQEDWDGSLHHVIERFFDGDRLLSFEDDRDGDGSVDVSDVFVYDEDERTMRAVHTNPDGQTRTRTVWDEHGRIASRGMDRTGDGEDEESYRYEWTEDMLTVTTTRAEGLSSGYRYLFGDDGLVDGTEVTTAGETVSFERFSREGTRVFRRTSGPDLDYPRSVAEYTWDGDHVVAENSYNTEPPGAEQSVTAEYDGAGRLSRRVFASPTRGIWAAIVLFSYDGDGRLSEVIIRDPEDREIWRTWRFTTNCPAGFAHDVPVSPVGGYQKHWRTTPVHIVDLANVPWMTSPF